MQGELASMGVNGAGSLWINLMGPKRRVAAGFSLSRSDHKGIERYKARLVVQGFAALWR
jgi:hypothetical protein